MNIRVLALGAGVQSSTLALKAEKGEILRPDFAIFSDIRSEPKRVYEWLDWLEKQLSYPVYRVSAGSLKETLLYPERFKRIARIPFYLRMPDGSAGFMARQCTRDYKINPIIKKIRDELGLKPKQHIPKGTIVTEIFGISLDEAHRMKPSGHTWLINEYPLVDERMTRWDCIQWMQRNYGVTPPWSSCTFCPFHDDFTWRELQRDDPESFAEAVAVYKSLREKKPSDLNGIPYLHKSLIPLDEVDFDNAEDKGQGAMFGNECEGMCGV